jgi:hypothetical protein
MSFHIVTNLPIIDNYNIIYTDNNLINSIIERDNTIIIL